jgi:peptidoglycan/LPS O-acetylase OafA/YrhL
MLKKIFKAYSEDITEIPELLKTAHLPSLDGFRGVSILLVVIGHTCARIESRWLQFFFNGSLGVYVFFVISGFLITTLLLKERIKTGTISMRNFYIRRFLRIFPVAYLYLLVLAILNYLLNLHIPMLAFTGAILYIMNFEYFQVNWYTHHYWSLSIEEQFYLIFPSILKKNLRFYAWLLPVLLVTIPVAIFICRKNDYLLHSYFYDFVHFLLKFDGILTGSFFAILYFKKLIPMAWIMKYKIPLNFVLILLTMIIHNNSQLEAINHLSPFFIAIIIISNLETANDFIFRFLNNRLLAKIGILSYSIYIWQQLFTMTKSEPTYKDIPWYSFPINMILLFVISYLSYNYYEKGFLKLKSRFK